MMNVMLISHDLTAMADLDNLLRLDARFRMVSRCTDLKNAWVHVQKQRPDAVFLDIDMPGTDGLALAEKIRRKNARAVIIFVCADPQHAFAAYNVYPLDYLVKPISRTRLQRTIDRLFLSLPEAPASTTTSLHPQQRVRCFGQYEITIGGYRQGTLHQPNRQIRDLLAFFLTRYDRPVTREDLLENLFRRQSDARAVNMLHVNIYKLRQMLRQYGSKPVKDGHSGIAIIGHYRIQVTDGICDLVDFARFVRSSQPVDEAHIQEAERIAALYRGPCFELEDYPWAEDLRAELEVAYEQLLLKIAAFHQSARQTARSELTLMTLVKVNPYSEEGNCALLDLYLQGRDHRKYIRHFETYNRILTEELDVMIDHQYEKAYRELRQS